MLNAIRCKNENHNAYNAIVGGALTKLLKACILCNVLWTLAIEPTESDQRHLDPSVKATYFAISVL